MKEINSMEEFDNFIKENDNAVVDFWAQWCGPCRMMLPLLENIQAETNKVAFAKVNIDDNQDITERFGITSIPYLIKFTGGKQDNINVGATSRSTLEKFCGINE